MTFYAMNTESKIIRFCLMCTYLIHNRVVMKSFICLFIYYVIVHEVQIQ